MSLVGTYTYENGTDGQNVVVGSNGVTDTTGPAVYSTAAAVHGNLGISLGTLWAYVAYQSIALPMTGSVYMRRGPETPTSRISFITFKDGADGTTNAFEIGIKKTGELILQDGPGNILATTTLATAPGDTTRCDWQATTDGTNVQLSARFYTGSNLEGTTPDASLTATIASTATTVITELVTYSTTTLMFDTLRLWNDVSAWPGPYTPSAPSVTVWNGTSEVNGTLTVWNGTSEVPLSSIEVL